MTNNDALKAFDKWIEHLEGCQFQSAEDMSLAEHAETIRTALRRSEKVAALEQAIEDIWPTLQRANSTQGLSGDKAGWIMETIDNALQQFSDAEGQE